MDILGNGMFTEMSDVWPGTALSLEVNEVLHHEKSKFQDVLVVATKSHGNALILDGLIQCTERDEFSYQETITFIPLCCHPNPEKVLIIGGGGGAREVAKHPGVKSITQVEIDPLVLEVSKKYLHFMSKGFSHPNFELIVDDGFEYLKNCSKKFDVIITDSSEPIGPNASLFQESYFKLLRDSLRPGGIICSQAGTTWANLDQVAENLKHCKSVFPNSAYGIVAVPTFATGQIGFVVGSLNPETNLKEPLRTFSEDELDDMKMRYYNAEVHRAAFGLPRFVAKVLHAD